MLSWIDKITSIRRRSDGSTPRPYLDLWLHLALISIGVLVNGCDSNDSMDAVDSEPLMTCDIVDQNRFIHRIMQDIYFWNHQLPDVDPAAFDSPEALLEALRFQPLDRFSVILSEERFNNVLAGRAISFGFGYLWDKGTLRLTQVLRGSAAAEAGLERGQQILAINGQTVSDLVSADGPQTLERLLSPRQINVSVMLRLTDQHGGLLDVDLRSESSVIDLVPIVAVFNVAGRPTGYLFFRGFYASTIQALSSSFEMFQARGVADLILDLRYNGGGESDMREFLGNLIAGLRAEGQVSSQAVYNANNQALNTTSRFVPLAASLDVSRLVVITTFATGSASEQLINGLTPHLDVTTVGAATFGKPMALFPFPFCDKVLLPATLQALNANGEGDFFDGIPPDCPAIDDLDMALGEPSETSLATALFVVEHNRCPDPPSARISRRSPPFMRSMPGMINGFPPIGAMP